MQDMQT
jgi:hypothetical protein